MRAYVLHDRQGTILSIMKPGPGHPATAEPYVVFGEGQGVLVVELTGELGGLACHELHEHFAVDVGRQALQPLDEPAGKPAEHPGPPKRRRKTEER